MPFTPAHAVAARPFRKCKLPFAPIVVGTLAPDLEMYFRLAPRGTFGHTLLGCFVLDLPLSLLTLWLYETTVRPAIEDCVPGLFPDGASPSLTPHRTFLDLMLLIAAVMLGIVTHIALDSFTHPGYWPYAHFAVLRATLHAPGLPSVKIYMLLQCVSSVVGMCLLSLLWGKWIRQTPGWRLRVKTLGWWMLVFAFLIAIVRATAGEPLQRQHLHIGLFATETIITFCSALALELAIAGFLGRRMHRESRQRS